MAESMSGRGEDSGWVLGGVIFAATTMMMIGIFQAFQGLAAIIDDEFYVTLPNYTYEIDTTSWGWIHLILGIVVAAAGAFLFTGSRIAGVVAIILAVLSAVANFFFVPYYPFWALLLIAMALFAIWAVVRGVFES